MWRLTANYEEWQHLDGNNQLKIMVEGRNEEEETESAATYKVNRTEIRHIETSQRPNCIPHRQ